MNDIKYDGTVKFISYVKMTKWEGIHNGQKFSAEINDLPVKYFQFNNNCSLL